jgi:carboxylesterase
MPPAEAFALGDGPDVCLLLHGFTGSPAEVRPLGEALARAGIRSLGPLLPGHGTNPEDLFTTTHAELVQAAESALLGLRGSRRVFLCGLSAGALLAIHLASRSWLREGLPDLTAMALLAPAVEFSGATWLYAEVLGRLPALPVLLSKGARDISEVDDREREATAYSAVPMRWGRELRELSAAAQKLAPRVRIPTIILQGGKDRTVSVAGARKLSRMLGTVHQPEVRLFPGSGHVLPLDRDRDAVCAQVVQFFLDQKTQGGK